MTENKGYNVVFEGVGGENSNVKGMRTWTSFSSEAAFNEWKSKSKNADSVVASGVSEEDAISECRKTSIQAHINTAFAQSTFAGDTNEARLQMHLKNLALLRPEEVEKYLQNN